MNNCLSQCLVKSFKVLENVCLRSHTDLCTAVAEMQVFAYLGSPSQRGSNLWQTGGANGERKKSFNALV